MTGKELLYIAKANFDNKLAGDGPFTKKCHLWLEKKMGTQKALLTHSCTAALEMTAILADIQPGDEVILPSFTFVSTANAFVLRGAVPVFIDIRPDTLNLDETKIEEAITLKTKVIVPVHYAGVGCEMDTILSIAEENDIMVIEDAAQAVMASYKGRPLGTLGQLGAFSFHETKNVISGEGGALLVNDPSLIKRAEIIREKGTDRSRFYRGEADKYMWQEIGSSYLPGELVAAFLWAQLEEAEYITQERLICWQRYHDLFEPLEAEGFLRRPVIPDTCGHNAHMYYILLASGIDRQKVIDELKRNDIFSVFHYVPLHSSPAGQRYGRSQGHLDVTIEKSESIVRLPLWVGLTENQQTRVAETFRRSL